MPKSAILFVVAAVFFVLASYAHYWATTHSTSVKQINIPVLLKEGSSTEASFVVENADDYRIEIWYPKSSSLHVMEDLYSMSGSAVLTSRGRAMKRATLPTGSIIGGEDSMGTGIMDFNAAANRPYALRIVISHLPDGFVGVASTLRIETDLRNYKIVLAVSWLSYFMAFAGLVCALLLIWTLLKLRSESH